MKSRRVGVCTVCGDRVVVTHNGIVTTHRGKSASGRNGCPGSGKTERQEAPE